MDITSSVYDDMRDRAARMLLRWKNLADAPTRRHETNDETRGGAMTTPVTVVATIRAKDGREAAVREVLEGLLAKTRAEAGCLNYDLHVSTDDPSTFLFHENWESKAHLDRHLESDHLSAFKARFDELLREPPAIDLYERIG